MIPPPLFAVRRSKARLLVAAALVLWWLAARCFGQGLSHSPAFRGAAAGFPTASQSTIKVDGFISFVSALSFGSLATTNDLYNHGWYTNAGNNYTATPQFYVANTQVTVDTNGYAAPLPMLVGSTTYTPTATNSYAFPRSNPVNGLEVQFNKQGSSGVSNLVVSFLIKNGSLSTNGGNGASPDLCQIQCAMGDTVYGNWVDHPGASQNYMRMENYDLSPGPSIVGTFTNQWVQLTLTWFYPGQNQISNYLSVYNSTNSYSLIGQSGFPIVTNGAVDFRAVNFVVGPYNAHGTFSGNQTSYVAAVWWRSYTNASTLGPGAVTMAAPPTADPEFMRWARRQPEVMGLLAEMNMLRRDDDESTLYDYEVRLR